MEDPMNLVGEICNVHSLSIAHAFTLGNIVRAVFKVHDQNHTPLVLKVGVDQRSAQEIRMNIRGYSNIREMGLGWFIPEILCDGELRGRPYILLEYCGEDFQTRIISEHTPDSMYTDLTLGLIKVYKTSMREGNEGSRMLRNIADEASRQYSVYVKDTMDPSGSMHGRLQRVTQNLQLDQVHFACFSNWDFTPDDVYLGPGGTLKYSDPHEEVVGVPIVDMACFAGLARDRHSLPGSTIGYQVLQAFAIEEIATLLHISSVQAQNIFCLGRLLQNLLSTRFRLLNGDDEAAHKYFDESQRYLDEIVH